MQRRTGWVAASVAVWLLAGVCEAGAPAPQRGRTRAEVEKLIADAGSTPPEWWDSTPLRVPPGLDLSFATGPQWNNQRYIGQYIWDIIDPNPGRWREGIKLVHHALSLNRNDPQAVERCIDALARMYAHLLEDHPRAAFWARKGRGNIVLLANCYWKMGSREMTVELIGRINRDPTRNASLVKLWAEMGDLERALRLAAGVAGEGRPDVAFLAAGDACRFAGRYEQAMEFYRRAAAITAGSTDLKMNVQRAQASYEAVRLFEALDLTKVPDGTYRSRSIAYVAPLEVAVTVKAGRIEDVRVTSHKEKQFYSSITDSTRQIIARQGVRGIDATSGATITSEAIINATARALGEAMQ
jgi:uncharacterized protein with FMN-binding domain